MSTKYFAVNTLAGAIRSDTLVLDGQTTAGRFDSTYVPSTIRCPSNGHTFDIGAPFADGSSTLTGTVYARFDAMWQSPTTNGDPPVLILNAGANAYRLLCSSASNFQFQYWNSGTSAWVNWGSTFAVVTATLYTMVIKLVVNTSFEVRINGSVVASSAVVPTNGAAAITLFRFGTPNATTASDYSQIMGADYDISDTHYMPKLANANGTYTDGTGTFTDINETVLDDSNAIALPAVGNKHTFTKTAITVPAGQQIGAMVVNIRGRVSGGVVTDGKVLIRSGVTDSASASKGFTASYAPRMQIADNDPATGTRFTQSGFNAAEFGLQAA